MTLTLAAKKAVVEEVTKVASKAISAVVADYRGLTVNQMTQLRSQARKSGVYLRVVRNTLARRAVHVRRVAENGQRVARLSMQFGRRA